MYIGNLSSNSNYIRFKKKFLLSECNIEEDRGEPRVLHLLIVMSDGTILLSHNFKVLMISYVNRLFLEKKKKIIKREKNITKTFVKKE